MRNTLIHLIIGSGFCLPAVAQQPGSHDGTDSAAVNSPLATETAYPYFTSDPYGRQPSLKFPEDPPSYYLRRETARALAASERCAEATDKLAELVSEFPDDSKLWVDLGLCQAETGELEAAIESLQTAMELGTGPFDGSFDAYPAEIMVKIGWLYAEIGDVDASIEWLSRGLDARFTRRPFMADAEAAPLLEADERFRELAGMPPGADFSRDERWRYDIEFLRTQTAQLHYDPDHHTPAVELERYLEELSANVPTLTDEQIVARLMLFMGRLGAGHDVLFAMPGETGAPVPFSIMLYAFTDGLFVTAAEDDSLVGARIDAIGDVPADEALRIASAAVSRDNNMIARWSAPRYLASPAMLEALGIVDTAAAATLTITDREGQVRTIAPTRHALAPTRTALVPPSSRIPLYLSNLDTQFWMQRLENSNALYTQINGLSDAPDEDFISFVDRLHKAVQDVEVRNLILDLRHNLGGNTYLGRYLLKTLVHFDMEPDKGTIFVLIGRNTFSAAQSFITQLESLTDAAFVGEPSGSRPNFLGRVGQFRLPFSGLSGFLSSELSQEADAEDHRIWTAPDMPVGLSSDEYFSGEDPGLEAVIDLIGRRQ